MSKSYLKMTKCDENRNLDSAKYELKLNPSQINLGKKILYNLHSAPGSSGANPKFNTYTPDKLDFEFIIDATGVISGIQSVKTELESIESVIYNYKGKDHEPGHVQIIWGYLIYYGRLNSYDTNYLMFSSDGAPLRAKVKIGFCSFESSSLSSAKSNKSSPDLSHIVEVKAGDTLPILCDRIYKDSSYYADVARINNLVDFRNLKPGTKLRFPPLR